MILIPGWSIIIKQLYDYYFPSFLPLRGQLQVLKLSDLYYFLSMWKMFPWDTEFVYFAFYAPCYPAWCRMSVSSLQGRSIKNNSFSCSVCVYLIRREKILVSSEKCKGLKFPLIFVYSWNQVAELSVLADLAKA